MDDPTNYDALKFWLDVAQWVFTIALMIFVWIDRGRSDNRNLIKQVAERQEVLERRLLTAEEQMRHLPTHDDFAKVQTQVAGLDSKLDRVTNTVDRVHDYLMNKGA